MADFGTTFERLELKYLITEEIAEQIRSLIRPWVTGDKFNGSAPGGGYRIENLYLDTPSLEFHKEWKRADADRVKLRIRSYSPSTPAFCEIKRKTTQVIAKERCAVARHTIEDAARGFGEPLNKTREQHEILERFAHTVARVGAVPTICVRYEREAYASNVDRYARVTFDRRIEAQPVSDWLLDGDRRRDWYHLDEAWLLDGLSSPVILELKCEPQMPRWISAIIQTFQLQLRGYSKYGLGIDAMILNTRGVDTRALRGAAYV